MCIDMDMIQAMPKTQEIDLKNYFTQEYMDSYSCFQNRYAVDTIKSAIVMFDREAIRRSIAVTVWCLEKVIREQRNIKTKRVK